MTPDVVAQFREEVVKQCAGTGPDVVAALLAEVDTVPHRGDDHAYIADAVAVLKTAYEASMQPVLAAAQAEADAARAHGDLLQAQFERWQREFEAFRRMRTPMTIQ